MKTKICTISLGCPKNRVDTEVMLGSMGHDFEPAQGLEDARVVLVNTCGFIQPAIEESLQVIMETAAELDEISPRPLLVVTGCLVNRAGVEMLADNIEGVDLWLTIDQQKDWGELICRALDQEPFSDPILRVYSTGGGYAYLKISEGCSHACAFCTIPSIRGPHKSRPMDELLIEARDMVDIGIPEIIVVGQDITAWGSDLDGDQGLADLVEALAGVEGLRRLRLMYLYPAGLTDAFLERLKKIGPPLVPYFDVPLQHAHPDILKSMGRPFARDPKKVIERIRQHFPEAAIRTSIITGYPGEGEEEFAALRDFIREARFHHMGVFAYCREDGTPADQLPGQVDEDTKEARRAELMEMQADISEEIMEGYEGQSLELVVDQDHPEWPGLYVARAWFQAPEVDGVTYVSGVMEEGDVVRADVQEAKVYDLVALGEGFEEE